MQKYYVFGHTNPDTDSVCAAITLANLKRELGYNAEERVLGDINKETKFVLDYFKVKEPKYLNDVKLRIKDIDYRHNCYLNEHTSIKDVHDYMLKENTTGVPIVDSNNKFINLITAKNILNRSLVINNTNLHTSYDNILNTINGKSIVKIDNDIKGNVTVVSYSHTSFEQNVDISSDDILIIGDRNYIIDLAINNKVKLLIIIGGFKLDKDKIKLAKKNKVNIISTNYDTFETSRLIMFSNYISTILSEEEPYVLYEKDYYDDFIHMSEDLKVDNYPVIDKNGICKGLIRKSEITKTNKRKVILVDHNETEQSALGIEEAEITEIVDHHKIGRISTSFPINFRNMIVGSTNTIIYYLYKENNIKINKKMAGLMISGILSDTLAFKSPTTTEIDKDVVKSLNKIAKININKFANEMFKAGTSLEGMSINDILNVDTKVFNSNDVSFAISQVFTMSYEDILDNIDEYVLEINRLKELNHVEHYIVSITDIINEGSYILYDDKSSILVMKAFNLKKVFEGVFVKKVISRKKQIVPSILNILEK